MDNNDFDTLNFDDDSTSDWSSDDQTLDFDSDMGQNHQGLDGSDEDFNDSVERATNNENSFDDSQNLSSPQQSKDTIKAAIMIVALGIAICVAALVVFRFLQNDKPQRENAVSSTLQEVPESQHQNIGTNGSNYINQGSQAIIENSTEDKWKEFTNNSMQIQFNKNYQTAKFSIQKVKHFVCVQEQDSDYIQVKTTLTGSIAGFPGVYQIDVPYSLGASLQANTEPFDVQILVGTYEGRTVIGDIRYY